MSSQSEFNYEQNLSEINNICNQIQILVGDNKYHITDKKVYDTNNNLVENIQLNNQLTLLFNKIDELKVLQQTKFNSLNEQLNDYLGSFDKVSTQFKKQINDIIFDNDYIYHYTNYNEPNFEEFINTASIQEQPPFRRTDYNLLFLQLLRIGPEKFYEEYIEFKDVYKDNKLFMFDILTGNRNTSDFSDIDKNKLEVYHESLQKLWNYHNFLRIFFNFTEFISVNHIYVNKIISFIQAYLIYHLINKFMEAKNIDCSFIKTRIQKNISRFENGIKNDFSENKLNEIKQDLNNLDNQNKINKLIDTITTEQQIFNIILEIWRKFNVPENNSNIKFKNCCIYTGSFIIN